MKCSARHPPTAPTRKTGNSTGRIRSHLDPPAGLFYIATTPEPEPFSEEYMPPKKDTGWLRLVKAVGYSIQGLRSAWRHETAFRQEVMLVLVLVPAACWLGTTMTQRALLIFTLALILVVELLNSAVESTVDRIGPEHHELSGRAKNMGSAAVLISLAAGFTVWLLVAWDRWGPG